MRYPIDEGNPLIPVLDNNSVCKLSIPGKILGNFSSIKQSRRSKYRRDLSIRLLGRVWSFSQPSRFQISSLPRDPTDSSTTIKFLHLERSNTSKFGVHKAGNSIMDSQDPHLIYFKFSNRIPYIRKKVKIYLKL